MFTVRSFWCLKHRKSLNLRLVWAQRYVFSLLPLDGIQTVNKLGSGGGKYRGYMKAKVDEIFTIEHDRIIVDQN